MDLCGDRDHLSQRSVVSGLQYGKGCQGETYDGSRWFRPIIPHAKENDTTEVEKSFAVADVFGSIKSSLLTKATQIGDIYNSTSNELENLYAKTKKGIGG